MAQSNRKRREARVPPRSKLCLPKPRRRVMRNKSKQRIRRRRRRSKNCPNLILLQSKALPKRLSMKHQRHQQVQIQMTFSVQEIHHQTINSNRMLSQPRMFQIPWTLARIRVNHQHLNKTYSVEAKTSSVIMTMMTMVILLEAGPT